jgi:hypothetical protein
MFLHQVSSTVIISKGSHFRRTSTFFKFRVPFLKECLEKKGFVSVFYFSFINVLKTLEKQNRLQPFMKLIFKIFSNWRDDHLLTVLYVLCFSFFESLQKFAHSNTVLRWINTPQFKKGTRKNKQIKLENSAGRRTQHLKWEAHRSQSSSTSTSSQRRPPEFSSRQLPGPRESRSGSLIINLYSLSVTSSRRRPPESFSRPPPGPREFRSGSLIVTSYPLSATVLHHRGRQKDPLPQPPGPREFRSGSLIVNCY